MDIQKYLDSLNSSVNTISFWLLLLKLNFRQILLIKSI